MKYLLLFFSLCYSINAQVVINEIDPDTPSTDVKEFIELHSITPNYSLNGLVLVFFNGTSTGTGNASYYAIDLDGFSTDINGNFLIGNSQVSPAPTLDLPETTLQNGPDAIALFLGNDFDYPINTLASTSNLLDAIAYSNSTTAPSVLMTALGLTTFVNEASTSNAANHSIQRKTDGTYEVKIPTPRMNNDGTGFALNYMTTTLNNSTYIENQNIIITFTTSSNVAVDTSFSISLNNGNFNNLDYSGNTSITINAGTNSVSTIINLLDDSLDEGDEEFIVYISGLPVQVIASNNSILRRVEDNDYLTSNFGTPLNPTYGNVTSTAPSNYYSSLEGLSGNSLKQALQDIIANPSEVHLHSYADIWDIIRVADQNPANHSKVWCMYIEQPMSKIDQQQSSSIVGKWNREHIFCQSRGGFEVASGDLADGISTWNATSASSTVDGVSDAHHIRVENGQENSSRNNKNYGINNTSTVYAGPTNTRGSWKGDVARSLFYMAVRFNGLNIVNGDPLEHNGTLPSGNIGDLATLLTWNSTDLRDDFEMNRNNYIYTWQNNRNPFIDYPNLVDYIFGAQYGQPWFSTLSQENLLNDKVKIYPNPAKDFLYIEGIDEGLVQVFNMQGQNIFEKKLFNLNELEINFPTGLYQFKISTKNEIYYKKIMVK